MRVVAIIPARGNSKRLHKKNIFPIWGKPMIYWSIEACKGSRYNIEPWVSTESNEIAAIAKKFGAKIHRRDPNLSGDKIYKQEVIRSAAKFISKCEESPDVFISLQANSPQIKSDHLDSAIDTLYQHNRDEIFSVDSNFMQNAAFRIFRQNYVFQRDLSTNCGVFVCDLYDIHTIEDVKYLEKVGEYEDRVC